MPARGTRPTTDRVRESLFNVLAARMDFQDAVVLDLYAGSGALGLEALSRGAASALFVESDRKAAAVVADNIATLGAVGTVRCAPVLKVLTGGAAKPVDLVFADPPYELAVADVEAVLAALHSHGWVAAGTVTVVERGAGGPALNWPEGWESVDERRYGDTRLEFGIA